MGGVGGGCKLCFLEYDGDRGAVNYPPHPGPLPQMGRENFIYRWVTGERKLIFNK